MTSISCFKGQWTCAF
uniref:Uncharacterized protein n=1 Tax=Rhizophora mucronata TaxID=61149 RepID=A0A2P2NT66_RHIMU